MDSFAWFRNINNEEVSHSICIGESFRGKEPTAAERETACKEFKQITGVDISQTNLNDETHMAAGIISGVFLFAILGLVLSKRMSKKTHSQVLKYIPLLMGIVAAVAVILGFLFWQNSSSTLHPVSYGECCLHETYYERVYGQNETMDTILSWVSILAVSAVLAGAIMLLIRRVMNTKAASKNIKRISRDNRLKKILVMAKRKLQHSKAQVILIVAVLVLAVAVLGSIFPISRSNTHYCSGNKPTRLSLVRGELGKFLDIKSDNDKLNKTGNSAGINVACNAIIQAELFIF